MWRSGVVVWGLFLYGRLAFFVCVQGDPGANGPKGPTGPAGPDGKVRGPCFLFHDGYILFQCVRILALCLHRHLIAFFLWLSRITRIPVLLQLRN